MSRVQEARRPVAIPVASPVDDLIFAAVVAVPNLLQGLFRPEAAAVAVASVLDVDRLAVSFIAGLRNARGPGPIWIRVGTERSLLVLDRDDVRRVLERSPCPYAPDPGTKRKGMSHFQPDALTISRGELWENRRRFTESVLDSDADRHRSADGFVVVVREETTRLLDDPGTVTVTWDRWHTAFRRIARRIVLGEAAADDEHVSDLLAGLMAEANRIPAHRSTRFEPFMARLTGYVDDAAPGSLVALVGEAPADDRTDAAGQIPHWMFALSDTLAVNAFRALALLAIEAPERADWMTAPVADDSPHLRACLEEAMRLWPTTRMLARVTVEDTEWAGVVVPAGTQVLISNTFNHRDPATQEHADRFAPDAWSDRDTNQDWALNHFSHGPARCPGARLALLVGSEVLATVLRRGEPRLVRPRIASDRPLPHMLDPFRLRFDLQHRSR